MNFNMLEIIIAVVALVFAVWGYYRGFVKKLASMLSLALSVALVSALLPYMTDFLQNQTPVYEYIVTQCDHIITEKVTPALLSSGGSTEIDRYRNMSRDEIKNALRMYGMDEYIAQIDTLSDSELENYKDQYLEQILEEYLGINTEGSSVIADTLNGLGKIEQTELIESLPLPNIIKELLVDNNNSEGYSSLNAKNFEEYLIRFVAKVILNLVSFIAAVLVVQLLLWALIAALNFISHIPVISLLNRLLGMVLGLAQALLLIWAFFLLLTMISGTEQGMMLMKMVEDSKILSTLYDSNLFMHIVLQTAAIFA